MRILVCGGRNFKDEELLNKTLDNILFKDGVYQFIGTLIHGCARGADSLAAGWGYRMGWKVKGFHADWSLGKKAGYLRNKQMLEEGKPDLVVAFPGGKGTANMIQLAKEAGVEVKEIK